MITETVVLVGGISTIIGAWVFGKASKSGKSKAHPEVKLPPNVFHYERHSEFFCPKCGLKWHYNNSAPKYCECDEFYEGHFHMECSGSRGDQKDVGCQFKWLMLTKDSDLNKVKK